MTKGPKLRPEGAPHLGETYKDWRDFTNRVARPWLDNDGADPKADAWYMALMLERDPWYLACALVMADNAIRRLEDALLAVWGELPTEESLRLRAEWPALADFCAHLHHSIEHEQAMVRINVWAPGR